MLLFISMTIQVCLFLYNFTTLRNISPQSVPTLFNSVEIYFI